MQNGRPVMRLGYVLAVLAMVAVRLLTPAGWMPNPKGYDASLLISGS